MGAASWSCQGSSIGNPGEPTTTPDQSGQSGHPDQSDQSDQSDQPGQLLPMSGWLLALSGRDA